MPRTPSHRPLRAPARPGGRARRPALAGGLALALAGSPPAAANLSPETGEVGEVGRLTAEGQAHREAGDLDGAIARWQQALAALPATQASAHRRAGLTLAIADAHVAAGGRDPARLQAALEVLDAYLASLDPTDDEHRVAVEQRRAEVAGRLAAARPPAPPPPRATPAARPPDPRLAVAGGAVLGLGAVGLVVLAAGLATGARADRDLAAAVARPGDDPTRDDAKAAALARGQRANDAALAGGVTGGALALAGAALLIAAAVRRSRPRAARWRLSLLPGGAALVVSGRF
jgi:hypothetical protein